MTAQSMPEVNSILQHSPNGVVLVDEQCRVQYANPAMRRMFCTGNGDLTGQNASEILHSDCFEQAFQASGELTIRGRLPDRDFHYRATLFRIEGENRCCGIFVDVTEEERARAEWSQVRRETLARAQEVIRRQMHTAQEIAGLLGETTAETKVLLSKLTDLFHREGAP